MKKVLLPLFVCSTVVLSAQVYDVHPGSQSIANSGVSETAFWSAFQNPATLVQKERFQFSFQFENRYLIPELSTKAVQVGYCNPIVNIGLSFSHFGYGAYSEMMTGVTVARNFDNRFSLGVQGNLYTAYFGQEAGYKTTLLPQVGATVRLSERFTLGFNTFNPFQQHLKGDMVTKRLPSLFTLGTCYTLVPQLTWLVQVDKEVSSYFRMATGFEWQAVEFLCIKVGGYALSDFIGCFGVALDFSSYRFDLNCELHPQLGLNTLAKVSYTLH